MSSDSPRTVNQEVAIALSNLVCGVLLLQSWEFHMAVPAQLEVAEVVSHLLMA